MKSHPDELYHAAVNENWWQITMRDENQKTLDDFLLYYFKGEATEKRLAAVFGKNATTCMMVNSVIVRSMSAISFDEDAAGEIGRIIANGIVSGDISLFRELMKAVSSAKGKPVWQAELPPPEAIGGTLAAAILDSLVDLSMAGTLPTKSQLKASIEWKGDAREFNEAMVSLGLSGLPHAKSGRPKKGGGFLLKYSPIIEMQRPAMVFVCPQQNALRSRASGFPTRLRSLPKW